MRISLQNIRSDHGGFLRLVELAAQTDDAIFEEIAIDFAGINWIDANMCAPLGAILYKISRQANSLSLENIPESIRKILSKNGFLSNYGGEKKPDTYHTTIEYKRFESKDDKYFATYVEQHLVGKGLPKMSTGLQKKFREAIYEIFNNAVTHSETELGIFSCGQYFPQARRFDFSIADLGIGMKENVKRNAGLDFSAEEAIRWATEARNTTKRGSIPGGLGLKLLCEFIKLNEGRIQIVSDAGFWQLEKSTVTTTPLPVAFPGTVVNVEINTRDTNTYRLTSEVGSKNVF